MKMTYTAWDLIGFDGTMEVIDRNLDGDGPYADAGYEARAAAVRIVGGRTLYESVGNDGGELVRLSRLCVADEIYTLTRYVTADTLLQVITI